MYDFQALKMWLFVLLLSVRLWCRPSGHRCRQNEMRVNAWAISIFPLILLEISNGQKNFDSIAPLLLCQWVNYCVPRVGQVNAFSGLPMWGIACGSQKYSILTVKGALYHFGETTHATVQRCHLLKMLGKWVQFLRPPFAGVLFIPIALIDAQHA